MPVLKYKAVSKHKSFMEDFKEHQMYFESTSWTTDPLHPAWYYIRQEVFDSELFFELLYEI